MSVVDILVENRSARNETMSTKEDSRPTGSHFSLVPLSMHCEQFTRLALCLHVVQFEARRAAVHRFIGRLAVVRHEREQEGGDAGGGGGVLVLSAAVATEVGEKNPVRQTVGIA